MGWFFWLAASVLLFWSVGAYNRLIRLRSDAMVSFAALDAALARRVELVRSFLPDVQGGETGAGTDARASVWAGLDGAAHQFGACLNAARNRPLEPGAIAALAAACDVLAMAWQRVQLEAGDLAGPALPESVCAEWDQLTQRVGSAREHFGQCVASYNQAIAQLPALLLAWIFSFRPARAL
ncbi:MAG: LemA family protein [Burkholderiaceae bacterium]|nr:LemA family protein [Burkholderiaceae bacterium]